MSEMTYRIALLAQDIAVLSHECRLEAARAIPQHLASAIRIQHGNDAAIEFLAELYEETVAADKSLRRKQDNSLHSEGE